MRVYEHSALSIPVEKKATYIIIMAIMPSTNCHGHVTKMIEDDDCFGETADRKYFFKFTMATYYGDWLRLATRSFPVLRSNYWR